MNSKRKESQRDKLERELLTALEREGLSIAGLLRERRVRRYKTDFWQRWRGGEQAATEMANLERKDREIYYEREETVRSTSYDNGGATSKQQWQQRGSATEDKEKMAWVDEQLFCVLEK
ncbi:hypothetical protein HN51_038513 [Arachis hypogaea]